LLVLSFPLLELPSFEWHLSAQVSGIPPDVANGTAGGGAVAVAAGELHSLVLLADGTLRVWGSDYYGQLDAPPAVASGGGVVAIAAGDSHSLVLMQDGSLAVWGQYNDDVNATVPEGVQGGAPIIALAAGCGHAPLRRSALIRFRRASRELKMAVRGSGRGLSILGL
jgi:hypothetical protein